MVEISKTSILSLLAETNRRSQLKLNVHCGFGNGILRLYEALQIKLRLELAEPILYLAAMGWVRRFCGRNKGMPYINFIAPGIIASSSMFAVIYECTYGTYVRIVFQKTLRPSLQHL